jgi:hypothetical protein
MVSSIHFGKVGLDYIMQLWLEVSILATLDWITTFNYGSKYQILEKMYPSTRHVRERASEHIL